MTPPYIGAVADPMDAADGGCLFHGRSPADPRCTQAAITHLMLKDGTHGVVSVAACAQHEPIARAAGTVLREHPHEAVCGMPGAIWLQPPENRCVLDVSGVERPALMAEVAS